MVPTEIKRRVLDRVAECINIAKQRYGEDFEMPRVVYKVRGCTAGRAHLDTWTVDFNEVLLVENVDHFIHQTVAHEVAHLIDFKMYPSNHQVYYGQKRSQHGPTWKRIMRILGAKPNRCHSYDTTNSRVKRDSYKYRCTGCGTVITLSSRRHNKERLLPGTFWHRPCRGHKLMYMGSDRPNREYSVAASNPEPAPSKRGGGTTWRGVANRIYTGTTSRADFINKCVEVGIKKTTAGTYYQNFKSGKWK